MQMGPAQRTLESDWLVSIIDATSSFSVGLTVLLLGAWPVWKATQSLGRREALRAAAVPLLGLVSFAVAVRTPVPTDQGTWQCATCGAYREELRYLDFTVLASPERASACGARGEASEETCDPHDWSATGCHSFGRDLSRAESTAWIYPIN
jgi:hypothetical protein